MLLAASGGGEEMNWAKEKPTEAGFYWYYEPGHEVEMQEIIKAGVWEPEVVNADTSSPLEDYNGWWLGPLEPPAPPTEGE